MQNDLPIILAVDDTRENLNILLSLLSGYDVLVALDGKKALEIIGREKIDLVLLDISMPEMNGYEICRILKTAERTRDIPVIFLTAKDDEESIEQAYDVGGVDFITKPFKPRELLARVKIQIDFRKMVQKLEYMASYDTMTGIYNRRKFFEQGQLLFSTTPRDLYAIIIDIDQFKKINDTYGHPVGDIVIRKIARSIAGSLPKDAVLGRLGGEEFAIILQAPSLDTVRNLAETLRTTVAEMKIKHDSGYLKGVTISNGISKIGPNDTLDTFLNRADEALYEAKETGRNKVCFRC
jgi:diguanylate cyclase (GGDEF)-like protein